MSNTCKSCGAAIEWQETPKGRWLPVERAFLKVERCDPAHPEAERVVLVDDGSVVSAARLDPLSPTGLVARQPHWSTCPAADHHRRQAQAGREPWQVSLRKLGDELAGLKGVAGAVVAAHQACFDAADVAARREAWARLGEAVEALAARTGGAS